MHKDFKLKWFHRFITLIDLIGKLGYNLKQCINFVFI